VLRAPLAARLAEGAAAVSAPARVEIARGALALLRAHPWLGVGPDAFGLAFPAVQSAALWRNEWIGQPVHAHSVALQVLATGGALSALAGLAWLAAAALAVVAAWRSGPDVRPVALAIGAALAALVVGGIVNPVGLAGAAFFVVLAALAANAAAGALVEPPLVRRAQVPALAAALAVAALAGFGAARETIAFAAAGRARDALTETITAPRSERSGLIARAAREAARAAARAPGEDELSRLECDAALALAADRAARADFAAADSAASGADEAAHAALRLEPHRASNHQRYANALVMRARIAAVGAPRGDGEVAARIDSLMTHADAAFGEARSLAPSDALILVDQARGQLALGRAIPALETARAVIALYPEAATGHALEAAALLTLRRGDEARAALLRARAARWEEGSESERRAVEGLLRALDGDAPR
jgi:hypothetical protein